MKVEIFVEGGGPYAKRHAAVACRKAFHLLFAKILGDLPSPRITASGARDEAYRDFCQSVDGGVPGLLPVLLVDSESPVPTGKSARSHLRDRDNWNKDVPEGQVHLMVQCMESWFLADIPAVVDYYNGEIDESNLQGNPNIEAIPKNDVLNRIAEATRTTRKGKYDKGTDGFEILRVIDPSLVRRSSPHAARLFDLLLKHLA